MFSHVMGHKHRQRFVEEIYKDDPSRVMDLSQGDLLKYARTHNENGDDLGKRIRSRRSDEVGCGQCLLQNNIKYLPGIPMATRQSSLGPGEGRDRDTTRWGEGELG
jgi:hypothetical protein